MSSFWSYVKVDLGKFGFPCLGFIFVWKQVKFKIGNQQMISKKIVAVYFSA